MVKIKDTWFTSALDTVDFPLIRQSGGRSQVAFTSKHKRAAEANWWPFKTREGPGFHPPWWISEWWKTFLWWAKQHKVKNISGRGIQRHRLPRLIGCFRLNEALSRMRDSRAAALNSCLGRLESGSARSLPPLTGGARLSERIAVWLHGGGGSVFVFFSIQSAFLCLVPRRASQLLSSFSSPTELNFQGAFITPPPRVFSPSHARVRGRACTCGHSILAIKICGYFGSH